MASLENIFSQALSHIGNASVSGPDDQGQAAKACRLHYEQCRDWFLRRFPWNFARRRVALADTGAPPTNWAYSYVYPTDCLRALALVVPGARVPRVDQSEPFEVAFDGDKRVLYTDLPLAELIYTARVSDTTMFDPAFTSALSWYLAAEVAMPLTVKVDLANAARNTANQLALAAMALDGSEGFSGVEPDGQFLAGRA